MLHHLAGASMQVAHLVDYNCHPQIDDKKRMTIMARIRFLPLLCFTLKKRMATIANQLMATRDKTKLT